MTPTMLKAMLTRWSTLPHLLSAGAQELRFLTSFIAVLFLVFLLFTMQNYTHHGQKSSTSNLKKTKLSLNSKKMKHRGLTPLFHFQKNKSEKQGKSETSGSDPFVSFSGKNKSKKQGKSETSGSDPIVSFSGKNKSKKTGKNETSGSDPFVSFSGKTNQKNREK